MPWTLAPADVDVWASSSTILLQSGRRPRPQAVTPPQWPWRRQNSFEEVGGRATSKLHSLPPRSHTPHGDQPSTYHPPNGCRTSNTTFKHFFTGATLQPKNLLPPPLVTTKMRKDYAPAKSSPKNLIHTIRAVTHNTEKKPPTPLLLQHFKQGFDIVFLQELRKKPLLPHIYNVKKVTEL